MAAALEDVSAGFSGSLAGAGAASGFASGAGVAGAEGVAAAIDEDSAGFSGSLAAGAGVASDFVSGVGAVGAVLSAAGAAAILSFSDAGAGAEAAGLFSGFVSAWQAVSPTAAHATTATASLLLNLFTSFLFLRPTLLAAISKHCLGSSSPKLHAL